jgi:hypothetical protein
LPVDMIEKYKKHIENLMNEEMGYWIWIGLGKIFLSTIDPKTTAHFIREIVSIYKEDLHINNLFRLLNIRTFTITSI